MKRRLGLAAARWACDAMFFAALLGGCSRDHIGPPPAAPSVAQPLDAMPGDLDLVVRLDLHRIRDTLGAPAMANIAEQAVHSLHGADQATDALLLRALGQTDTLWLGVRPTAGLEAADTVLVMVGHFPNFDPHGVASTPPFAAPIELGAAFRRYDRAHPKARSAPARFYTRADDLLVSLSEAEIDSVERSLEERRGAPPLEPPEKGTLSAVLRPRALPPELFDLAPSLERLARTAERCELTADLTSVGVDASVSLKFEDSSAATRVEHALTDVRDALKSAPGRLSKLVTRIDVSSAAEFVTLRLSLARDELSELVNCRGSGCAW
ncbi:MAG TPA: hypothetical protein VK745_23035 [Polyangiaceae bacterium]|jgi:hypothetical protein|nr:hypothetical protein [Polyangiaceae bacterium]